jgi:anti-sigma factor RsiW
MNCDSAAELIEALAAGEIEPSHELSAHLDACPRCATGLNIARLIHQSLASGRAQPPRHFTANVLQRLQRVPERTSDIADGLEAWFDTIAALSLLPVIAGIWFLADPAVLRQVIDTIQSVVSGVYALLPAPRTVPTAYITVAFVAITAAISLGFFVEEI